MQPYLEPGRDVYKLRIKLPGGRRKTCSCGTTSKATARLVALFVEQLRADRRWDVLTAIVDGKISLAEAFDLRNDVTQIVAVSTAVDLSPLVEQWYEEKRRAIKGGASAAKYYHQVRRLIPAGKRFLATEFTRRRILAHLKELPVTDPTRNRHKAAISSFANFLLDLEILDENPVRSIRGWGEAAGRDVHYAREEAQRLIAALPQPYQAIEALMAAAALDWNAITRLRVEDVSLDAATPTVRLRGSKTRWRNRLNPIIETWTIPYIRPALEGKEPTALVFDGISHGQAWRAHRKAVMACKLPTSRLHDWRHTLAVQMLRDGYSPMAVASVLGHSTVALVWKTYGRFVVDARDFVRRTELLGPVVPATQPQSP